MFAQLNTRNICSRAGTTWHTARNLDKKKSNMLISYFLITILIGLLIHLVRKPKHFPPGPPRLPLLGSLPFLASKGILDQSFLHTAQNVTKVYGKICGLYLGTIQTVIVSDYEVMKKLLKMEETANRPPLYPHDEARLGYDLPIARKHKSVLGVGSSNGEIWRESRRYVMRNLRDFGFGKTSMEDLLLIEVEKLCNKFQQNVGQVFNPSGTMNISIVNALWVIMVGESLELDDPKLLTIVKDVEYLIRTASKLSLLNFVIPLPGLLKLPGLRDKAGLTLEKNALKKVHQLIQGYLTERLNNFEAESKSDLLDVMVAHVKTSTDTNSVFHMETSGKETIINIFTELFIAGMETSSSSLLWAFAFLLNYPNVQKKIHEEIDKVVGRDRWPRLEDQENMPYVNAFLDESFRMASLVHSSVPHYTMEEIKVGDYIIPKNTTIMSNLYHIMHDPDYFEDPNTFKPERFIDADGKYFHDKRVIPFSIGKRYCPGQPLAEKEIFLFFAGILQRFALSNVNDHTIPPIDLESTRPFGLARIAPQYDLILNSRY